MVEWLVGRIPSPWNRAIGLPHDRHSRSEPGPSGLCRCTRCQVLGEESCALTGTDDVFVKVGTQTVIQISCPHDVPSLARTDLEVNGSMLHAVAFEVRDLDAAEAHLRTKGIGVIARDERILVADPADTFGAPFRFTTTSWTRDTDSR